MIVNILYYVYQVIINRGLPIVEYGILSQVIALTTIGSIPSVIVSLLVMRYLTVADRDNSINLVRYIWRGVLIGIGVFTIACIFLSPVILRIVQIDITLYAMIVINIIVIVCLAFWRSVEYSRDHIMLYGSSFILEVSLRIVLSYVFLIYSQDIHGLYAIYLLSYIIPLSLFYPQIRELSMIPYRCTTEDTYKKVKSHILPLSMMAISITCIGNIEVILAGRMLGTI
jgi:hypothetical protein